MKSELRIINDRFQNKIHSLAPQELTIRGSVLDHNGHLIARKVAIFVLYAAVSLLYIPLLPFVLIPRAISYFNNKNFINGIQKARLKKLQEGLGIAGQIKSATHANMVAECKKDALLSNREIPDVGRFAFLVIAIRGSILSGRDPDQIRLLIDKAMRTTTYQHLKNTENPFIEFLQILAVKELSADGEEPLIEYGKKQIGEIEPNAQLSWGEVAEQIDVPANAPGLTTFQRRKIYHLFWMIAHPFEVLHALRSHWFPLDYNSHRNNPNFSNGYSFEIAFGGQRKKMGFYYGPGITGSSLYEDGVIPWHKKLQAKHRLRIKEVRFDYQDPRHQGESLRIFKQLEMASQSNGTLEVIPLDFNQIRHFSEGREFFSDSVKREAHCFQINSCIAQQDIGEFFNLYRDYRARNHFPQGEDWERAINATERMFTGLLANGASRRYWERLSTNDKGTQRLAKMMVLGVHAIYSVGATLRSLREISSEEEIEQIQSEIPGEDRDLIMSRSSGACKQDIDRGPMENIALQLFFSLLHSEGSLSAREAYLIAGGVIGRARIAEGRIPLFGRYQILSDLLHFVSDLNGQRIAQTAVHNYSQDS